MLHEGFCFLDLLTRESNKEEKRKEEIISTTGRDMCNDKKHGRSTIFSKLRLRKFKEADGDRAEENVKTGIKLQMPSNIEILQDSVKSLMKKGEKPKIKSTKSKEEKEIDNKQQMDKQQKKEEKEKRKKEDKKRKLKERYERVMMKHGLGETEASKEHYFQSYREHDVRFEKLEPSSNRWCVEGLLKNTENNNNYMDEERMKRIAELFAAKEHNAAVLKSRANKANGLSATGNGPKPDSEEVIELDQYDSSNDGGKSETRSVIGCAKTSLETTEHQSHPNVVSTTHCAQKQRMTKYAMRIAEVDTC